MQKSKKKIRNSIQHTNPKLPNSCLLEFNVILKTIFKHTLCKVHVRKLRKYLKLALQSWLYLWIWNPPVLWSDYTCRLIIVWHLCWLLNRFFHFYVFLFKSKSAFCLSEFEPGLPSSWRLLGNFTYLFSFSMYTCLGPCLSQTNYLNLNF